MAGRSLNLMQAIGNVGQDPQVRYTQAGMAVATFSLACNESWKDESGEKQEKTEWLRCTAWGKLAEIVNEFVKKGASLYISGRLSTRKWTDKQGVERYTTEVVVSQMLMLDKAGSGGYQPRDEDAPPEAKREARFGNTSSRTTPTPDDFGDDSIPF